MPDPQGPQTRTITRNRTRTRRFYACHRHPSEPVTGFCALCLTDRLSGLDSSPAPEFRRSKSVSGDKSTAVIDLKKDQRRSSCDVRVRNTLSHLFVVDDTCKAREEVESKDSRFDERDNYDDREIRVSDDAIGDDGREIRVSDEVVVKLGFRDEVFDDDEVIEGDLKTMKEIMEMELQIKRRNLRSVFSEKLRKWRKKHKEKKQSTQSEVADYGLGRRSCDTEPRFSIDAHRLSVEEPRFSLDEHRASWDGYMVARTIPRLTPMLSVVESMQMHSISSGGSGQLNSDCFSSSSMKSSYKTVGFGGDDDGKAGSNARVSPSDVVFQGTKLVITEKELKDWRLNYVKNNNNSVESASNAPYSTSKTGTINVTTPSNEQKKKVVSSRWKKVCNLWSQKQNADNKNLKIGNLSAKFFDNPKSIKSGTRRDEFVMDRNRGTRYSTSDIDSGLLRLYLTPFRNSRRNKFGRSRAPSSMVTKGLQLH